MCTILSAHILVLFKYNKVQTYLCSNMIYLCQFNLRSVGVFNIIQTGLNDLHISYQANTRGHYSHSLNHSYLICMHRKWKHTQTNICSPYECIKTSLSKYNYSSYTIFQMSHIEYHLYCSIWAIALTQNNIIKFRTMGLCPAHFKGQVIPA